MAPGTVASGAMLDALPPVVRRYLGWAGVEGRGVPACLSLRQRGRLRSANESRWLPFTAEEDYVTEPPAYSWRARVRIAGLPLVRARDSYVGGQGSMQVHVARVLPLVDLAGDELSQASLLRYLNELVWIPAAFLLDNVAWQEIDARTARVSIADSGLTASGTLTFGRDGRPLEFTAPRYRHIGHGRFRLEPWATPFTDYGTVHGVRVPTSGWAEYRTGAEPLKYLELHIEARLIGNAGL